MLLEPLNLGSFTLNNRVVMAPLTRARAGSSHIANDLIAEMYAQRASAGLLIAEATMAAADGCAFYGEPGIFNAETVAGWQKTTQAVHDKGGKIVLQIWHPGRAAHSLLNGGVQPISSSNKAIREDVIHTPQGKQPYEVPRVLATEELPGIVALFKTAAENAKAAGFDGIQVHAAHGYLIDQFLRDSVNDRTDNYGGSLENRARLLLEVVDACLQVWEKDRVSVRISPLVAFNDISDSQPEALVEYVAKALSARGIGFLELRHEDHALPAELALAKIARQHFQGVLMLNGGFDQASGEAALQSGLADAIVYGKAFIANPDLVARFASGAALNAVDFSTLYTPGATGYTDYPSL
jgi:N-ethylmaleimide reductase